MFYEKLNQLLAETGFDSWIENLCQTYYAQTGRPGIAPGVYFRMLLTGYFEGIGSQRGIAWRCSDSLSFRKFLGLALTEDSPDPSSLTVIRNRLPLEVHTAVFAWVLSVAHEKKLLNGKTVGVDSTTLEANAAMKSIVRRDTEENWQEYVTKLMRESGAIEPDAKRTIEEIVRFDKSRKDKKVSNDEWTSPTDPDGRIETMKDRTTRLAYKAKHAVDLASNLILALAVGSEIYLATQGDRETLEETVRKAQTNLNQAGSDQHVEEVVADKGYHSAAQIETFAEATPYRTDIPEPKQPRGQKRRWKNKPPSQQKAVIAARRRSQGARGKRLQRQRSEQVERTFAHACETAGARRTWLFGLEKASKRYLISAMSHNLGCLMRELFGMGTARGLQGAGRTCWGILMLCSLPKLLSASFGSDWMASSASRVASGDSYIQCAWPPLNGRKLSNFNGLLVGTLCQT